MARRKRPLPYIENLEIVDTGAEGKAVGKTDERVVFVPFAAPGDVVDVQVYKKKRSFYEARIERFEIKSPLRIAPRCAHFGLCGGCKWQHLDYDQQLLFKQKQVKDAFDRIAKVPYREIQPILASEDVYYYRNKLEFTFSNRKWLTDLDTSKEEGGPEHTNGLGFHLPGMFDKILDIDNCYLQSDPSNEIRLATKAYALDKGLSFYNVKKWEGLLRNIIIRNTVAGNLMVIVVFREYIEEAVDGLLSHLKASFPQITSLMYVINGKKNDSITDLEVKLFSGEPFIIETMKAPVEDLPALRFKIGPKSFYQTNSKQASVLYKTAFDLAAFTGDELVYDLYTGTGTIACYIASSVKKVVAVEYVEDAVADARENALLNTVENAEFYAGDLAKVLNNEFIEKHGKPQVIIADPPRSGMHDKVIVNILEAEPMKIVYVSCNPATQARDIALLHDKYDIKKVQPVDMFPQTHHVENVVLLQLREQIG
jgi:23S rRNA (uracil1939-C5)-methyltransferase